MECELSVGIVLMKGALGHAVENAAQGGFARVVTAIDDIHPPELPHVSLPIEIAEKPEFIDVDFCEHIRLCFGLKTATAAMGGLRLLLSFVFLVLGG